MQCVYCHKPIMGTAIEPPDGPGDWYVYHPSCWNEVVQNQEEIERFNAEEQAAYDKLNTQDE